MGKAEADVAANTGYINKLQSPPNGILFDAIRYAYILYLSSPWLELTYYTQKISPIIVKVSVVL